MNPLVVMKLMKLFEAVNMAQKIYKERTTPENQAKLAAAIADVKTFAQTRGPELGDVISGWLGRQPKTDGSVDVTDQDVESVATLLDQLSEKVAAGETTVGQAEVLKMVAEKIRLQDEEIKRLQEETITAQAKDALNKIKESDAGQKVIAGIGALGEMLRSRRDKDVA